MMKTKVKRLVCLLMALASIMSVTMPAAFASSRKITEGNVSRSPVTWNATVNPRLPVGESIFQAGRTIYFNFHVDESQKYNHVVLHIRHYTWNRSRNLYIPEEWKTYTDGAMKSYIRWSNFPIKTPNAAGKYEYYFTVYYNNKTVCNWPGGQQHNFVYIEK